jgi:hypothetical protein
MAVFAASFTVAQSADCTTLTFLDTSNYNTIASPSANTDGIAVSSFDTREFIISDSNYSVIDTVGLTGGALTGSYALTSDAWLSVELSLTNASPALDETTTHSVLSTCFLELCFSELVAATESGCACGCGGGSCTCDNTQNDKVLLLQFIRAAQIFAQYSNPVLAQKQLDAGTAVCQANENQNN